MKRGICLLTVLVLLGTVVSMGYAQQGPRKGWPESLSFGAGPVGSNGYIIGTGASALIQKYVKITTTCEAIGGSRAIINTASKKEVEMGLLLANEAYDGFRGLKKYGKLGPTPLRLIAAEPAAIVNAIAYAKKGMKKFEDMKGKRVITDLPAAPIHLETFTAMASAYGWTLNDVKGLKWTSYPEAVEMLDAGAADAFWTVLNVFSGNPTLKEKDLKEPILVLLPDLAKVEAACKKLGPVYYPDFLPAKHFKSMTVDCPGPGFGFLIFARADLPEDLVYEMARVMLKDHNDELVAVHPGGSKFTLAETLKFTNIIPFHKGTVRLLKEMGKWSKELEETNEKVLAEGK